MPRAFAVAAGRKSKSATLPKTLARGETREEEKKQDAGEGGEGDGGGGRKVKEGAVARGSSAKRIGDGSNVPAG